MKIRSITGFFHPEKIPISELETVADQIRKLEGSFEESGWEIQTKRLATVPFGIYTNPQNAITKIKQLENIAESLGFNYLSIGPARIQQPQEYALIPEILAETKNVFATGILTHRHKGISMDAIRACAKIITDIAPITPDGFTNLRFCAMSNVKPFTPFFPAAYSYGPSPSFALAIESADAAVRAFSSARTIAEGKNNLLRELNQAADTLSRIIRSAKLHWELPFKGFDFSLAPFPEDCCSLAKAIETLGIPRIGMMGSLSGAAILAETLDRGSWQKIGFNGLMLPVLEDSLLAKRSIEGTFSIKDLLMYSAVCGTGLDTVPLPGNFTSEKIAGLLMDVASLSLRLDKPLTARLMPVPGLEAGNMTNYDFDFFKNGKILDFPASDLGKTISTSKWIEIESRYRN